MAITFFLDIEDPSADYIQDCGPPNIEDGCQLGIDSIVVCSCSTNNCNTRTMIDEFIYSLNFVPYCGDPNISWIGDGFCDDVNNNSWCHYDGGDCCGENIQTDFCIECLCINEDIQASPYTA